MTTHKTIRNKVTMTFYYILINNLKSIWRPLATAAILLETPKWRPNISFSNTMISLFCFPCLLTLPNSSLTNISSVTRSLGFQLNEVSQNQWKNKRFWRVLCYYKQAYKKGIGKSLVYHKVQSIFYYLLYLGQYQKMKPLCQTCLLLIFFQINH